MHLEDFIGLKLQNIGHENDKLVFSFTNGCKIICGRLGEKDFMIKKEVIKSKEQIELEAERKKKARASAAARKKKADKARGKKTR